MDIATLSGEVQDYITTFREENGKWKERYSVLEEEYIILDERYKLLLLYRFGRKSEKELSDPNQRLLFNEDGSFDQEQTDEDKETITYSRKKRGRKPIDESLPREERIIDISEEEKQCECGRTMVKIGEEATERLHVIRPKMWVERIIRPKYACRYCEGSGDEDKPAVRIAETPPNIIPGSIVTPGLLAFVIVNKFVDHLPYYLAGKAV